MNETLRAQLDDLVTKNKIVLFMKGSRQFPQCGFSATVVQILETHGVKYETVNVLSSPEIREGIKEYSSWPTIPQLYVDGKFVGGCDIVRELDSSGELAGLVGAAGGGGGAPRAVPSAPKVTISKDARDAVLAAQADAGGDPLRVAIGPRWEYDLFFDAKQEGDVVAESEGLTVVFDPESAARAGELTIEFLAGQGFRVESSKAPARVRSLGASELKALLTSGESVVLLDVRPEGERALASIPGHTPLSPEVIEEIVEKGGSKVVVYCHHGGRSMSVAQQLVVQGAKEIYNLAGGIDAYSAVDPSIPRY